MKLWTKILNHFPNPIIETLKKDLAKHIELLEDEQRYNKKLEYAISDSGLSYIQFATPIDVMCVYINDTDMIAINQQSKLSDLVNKYMHDDHHADKTSKEIKACIGEYRARRRNHILSWDNDVVSNNDDPSIDAEAISKLSN
jgi:hypothetical protein